MSQQKIQGLTGPEHVPHPYYPEEIDVLATALDREWGRDMSALQGTRWLPFSKEMIKSVRIEYHPFRTTGPTAVWTSTLSVKFSDGATTVLAIPPHDDPDHEGCVGWRHSPCFFLSDMDAKSMRRADLINAALVGFLGEERDILLD